MIKDLNELSDLELLKFFENFKAQSQKKLKERKSSWSKEFPLLKRMENKKLKAWDDTTLQRRLQALDHRHNETKKGDPRVRMDIIDLIEKALDSWKLRADETGNLSERADNDPDVRVEIHYLCYYWLQNNVAKGGPAGIDIGYVSIGLGQDNQPITATMKLFDQFAMQDQHETFSKATATLVASKEEIFLGDQTLIVRLGDLDFIQIKSQLSLYVGKHLSPSIHSMPLITGAYTTVGRRRSSGSAIAGLIVLQKVKSYESAVEKILTTPRVIEDQIYHFLFGTRLSVGRFNLNNEDQLVNEEETIALKAYSGVYKADLVAESKGEIAIHELAVILIFPDTRAIMYVPNTNGPSPEPRTYYGRVRLVNDFNGNLVGSFDSSQTNGVSRFTMYIYKKVKPSFHDNPPMYYGVYAGTDYHSENIIAGRIRLTKSSKNLGDSEIVFKEMVASKPIDVEFSESDPDLFRLFSGSGHQYDFIETLKPKSVRDNKFLDPNAKEFPFAGNYFLYSLATEQDQISKIPVTIDRFGNVIFFRSSSELTGIANFDLHQTLTLNIYHQNQQGYISQYLFSALNMRKASDIKHLFGVSTRLARNTRPSARSEILVTARENWPNTPKTERIKINSSAFDLEDIQMKGLLSWMTGAYNRYIKMPLTPNTFHKSRMVNEFVNIHFYSACYLSESGKVEEAIKNLYQAYLHGFSDLSLLQKEIGKGGKLFPVIASKIKTSPGRPGDHNPEPLSSSEIVARIKARALHMSKIDTQ